LSYGLATRICDDPRAAALEVAREEIARQESRGDPRRQAHAEQSAHRSRPALLAESVEQMN